MTRDRNHSARPPDEPPDDDPIARLLHLAGPREAAAQKRTGRVRAEVKTLVRTGTDKDYAVTLTTALGRTTTYRVENLPNGSQRRTTTDAAVTSERVAVACLERKSVATRKNRRPGWFNRD